MILTGETCEVSKTSQVFGGLTRHDHCCEILVHKRNDSDGRGTSVMCPVRDAVLSEFLPHVFGGEGTPPAVPLRP